MIRFFALIVVLFSCGVLLGQQQEGQQSAEAIELLTELKEEISRDSSEQNNKPSGIYGLDMFRSDSLAVLRNGQVSLVPDNYVLGSGDEIAIALFGISQLDAVVTVTPQGYVKPHEMPKIYVKGMQWGKAKSLLKRRFASYYRFRGDQFAATIVQPRSITVNVIGEVEQPGSFRMEATNTVFNALIAAGGLGENANTRKINVFNGDSQITFDLYEYLNGNIAAQDLYLQDNATVQVLTAGNRVTISGAVVRPMVYELKDGEGLASLISFAGGLKGNAAKQNIQIERYENDQLVIVDVPYNETVGSVSDMMLKRGDVVNVREGSALLRNAVHVEGAVDFPGSYDLTKTRRISDLLNKARLSPTAKTDVAFLLRQNADSTFVLKELELDEILKDRNFKDNLELKENDKLVVNDQGIYSERATVKIKGAIRNESEYIFDPGSPVSLYQLIMISGGAQEDVAKDGYIIRSNPNNLTEKEYISIAVQDALANPSSKSNVQLRPWDEVILLSATQNSNVSYVSIRGEVKRPTKLKYAPTLRIADVLKLSGGLLPQASLSIKIYRVQPKQEEANTTEEIELDLLEDLSIAGNTDFRLMPNDEIVVFGVPEYEEQSFVTVQGEVVNPGQIALIGSNEDVLNLVKRSGGLTSDAFVLGSYLLREEKTAEQKDEKYEKIAISLDQAMRNPSGPFNVAVRAGDVLVVPKKNDVISIDLTNTRAYGSTQEGVTTIGAPYHEGKDALWYVENYAGGLSPAAEERSIYVEQANGARVATRRSWFKNRYPVPLLGATIYVGVKPIKEEHEAKSSTNEGVIINLGREYGIDDLKTANDSESNE